MPFFRVRWEIEIDATTPNEAVDKARLIQLDPDNTATHFEVRRSTDLDTAFSWSDVEYEKP